MKLITGSTALKYWYPDLKRNPQDLDVISPTLKKSIDVEVHWVPSFQYILDNNKSNEYVDPIFLYTIKISHAAWDIWFDKTMHDIRFMKLKGCELDETLYKMLFREWENLHGPKKIKLEGTPEAFFNSHISRTMPHDELHQLVRFYDKPMHEYLRPDLNNVKFSKDRWQNLTYDDKMKCALEEIYVFALERYMKYPPKIAFVKGLKQLITSSTKGYFNLFLIDNFYELLYYEKSNYLKVYKELK